VTASNQKPDIAWKPAPGASMVEVSTEGLVWSHHSRRLLAQTPNNKGRLRVKYVNDDGERVCVQVAVLVLTAHVGQRPSDWRGRPLEAAHRNGDKTDNRLANLRWKTAQANRRDRYGERRRLMRLAAALRRRLPGGNGE
jgi:hypothetical protein